MQGCNIACLYCHNPETQRMCINCGVCVPQCPTSSLSMVDGKVVWNEATCVDCDTCISVCPFYASPKITWYTPEELLEAIRPNIPFIRGVTVSGGEATLYPEFLTAFFKLAKAEGLSCLIDTNGMTDFSAHTDLVAAIDGVMLDIKSWDSEVYHCVTKAKSNDVVKKNLKFLSDHNLIEELRIVHVPDYVDSMAAIKGIYDTLGESALDLKLKLISFRNFGVRGELENHPAPTKEYMDKRYNYAKELGFRNIVLV